MKRFKTFIAELQAHAPVVSIDHQTGNLHSHGAVAEINRNLAVLSGVGYQNIHSAFNTIKKLLESYGVHLETIDFEDETKGSLKIPLSPYQSSGESLKDVTPPFSEKNVKYNLTFAYNLGDEGLYNIKAVIN